MHNLTRHMINEINGARKRFIPKLQWQRCLRLKRKTNINNMMMFAFGNDVSLMSMWTRGTVRYPNLF
jgi:hypothetical protein